MAKIQRPPDEIVFTMHRHIFGLVTLYVSTIVGVLASFGLLAWMASNSFDLSSEQKTIGLLIMGAVLLIVAGLLYMMTSIYWASKLVLTTEDVQQTIQNGLFNTKRSRLSLANVEDVTSFKKGFFASTVNFGTLNIETAGEQANFKFRYCPDPDECAKLIMDTREAYIEGSSGLDVSDIPR
ncbi:MAG: PH domain-containing protein [Patescibacteria group bacterium]